MGADSKIEWTHHTWNLWRGCTEVSSACDHCYARELAKRNPAVLGQWGKGAPRVLAADDYRRLPIKWDAQAEVAGVRRRVFALSMGDWLDDEVPAEWLAELLAMVFLTPRLDWLLLTKRPENFFRRMNAAWRSCVAKDVPWSHRVVGWAERGLAPSNVWIGTTVEDQARAEERIPALLRIPARVRFLSCEPLLGAFNFQAQCWNEYFGYYSSVSEGGWVIAGGESGQHARLMHPEWARGLRDQCEEAGVPFFFKQWGEWVPSSFGDAGAKLVRMTGQVGEVRADSCDDVPGSVVMCRTGKKAAGRKLDGREWSEFPTVEEKA